MGSKRTSEASALSEGAAARASRLLDETEPVRRGWEWEYLRPRCDRSRIAFRAHAGPVAALAFGANGATLVSAGAGDEIARFNFGTDDPFEVDAFLRDELGCRERGEDNHFVIAADDQGAFGVFDVLAADHAKTCDFV